MVLFFWSVWMKNLDVDTLRCFVLGLDLGSFSLAAERLHRSASTASAQLKKLEQQCDVPLVMKVGRHLKATEAGEVMLAYARRLIQLNDEALCALTDISESENVSFGIHEDFSEALLPKIGAMASETHTHMQLQPVVGRYDQLINGIQSGKLDFSLGWEGSKVQAYSELLGSLNLGWYGADNSLVKDSLREQRPLPLVMFDHHCLIRQKTIEALDHAGIPWKISFVGQSLTSLWQAVEAGLGITVRSSLCVPDHLIKINELPTPGSLRVCLNRSQPILSNEKQPLYDQVKAEILHYV